LHIFQAIVLIPTKFCTAIKTTNYAQWVIQAGGEQIQDNGLPPSSKMEKGHILAVA